MRSLAFFILIISLVGISPSCSKYPDGPAISLRTKANRLVNDWILTSYLVNGVEIIDNQPETKMVIDKDGTYSRHSSVNILGQLQSVFEHGTWVFNGEKTSVLFLKDEETLPVEYSIRELRSNKLVIQYYDKTTNKTYLSTYTTDK